MRPIRHARSRLLSVFGSLLIVAGLLPVAAVPALAAGTISLTALGTAYSETFDTLASTGTSSAVPNGWHFSETGTNSNTLYSAGTGSNNAGDTYSFGPAGVAERAFGGLQSGSLVPTIGASFVNATGATITAIDVSYIGEQWRLGTAGRADRIDLQYSSDATGLTGGTWTDVNALDFSSPVTSGALGALDGNASGNRTAISSTTGVLIPSGTTFWIRWNSSDATGADDGLAVDDFSLTPLQQDAAPFVSSTTPANASANVSRDSNVSITFSEAVAVAGTWYRITCASGGHTATVTGGPATYELNPDVDFAASESCTVTVFATQVTDVDADDPPDNMAADHTFTFTTAAPPVRIHDIQGASHTSPLANQNVSGVVGIVTAKRSNGYYMQDPSPDANEATSEGIFVFTSSPPTSVLVGDSVRVSARVSEFRPGGAASTNLTITELVSPTTTVLSSGNPLPSTTVVGSGGRVPPGTVIEDDAAGSVETSGVFDPAQDGIDFYESLEHMRLQLNNAVAVGPENQFGEIFVLADNGAGASVRTVRGGILVRDVDPAPPGDYRTGDFNPERIQLDDAILAGSTPAANVGDHFSGPAVGILDYDFGNFELNLTTALTTVSGGLTREVTRAPRDQEIVVGTYNVENLDPTDGSFARHADLIVNHLRSPDVIAIEEIQDNDGAATNTAVTDASVTWNMLIAAIQAAGGPTYEFRQIDPVDDQDGGAPGGNIRVGFLFRTDRGVEFIDRPGGDSVTPTTVVNHPSGPRLSFSPGRVDPLNPAYDDSRKPLVGEFRMHGKKVFVIALHLSSKGGDQPLFGRFQPPTRSSELARHAQAESVNGFVDQILAVDPDANVIVLGDVNDFDFSQTVEILEGGVLTTLMETLAPAERYSYVFEGNSQVLDQILVSNNLLAFPHDYDPVHVNAEFADQASDHDPQVVRLDLRGRPGR